MALYEETMGLLDRTDLSIRNISDATGVKVSWLRKVKNGEIPDPSVNKIQAVHDYLAAAEITKRYLRKAG